MEERLQFYATGQTPTKNVDAMKAASLEARKDEEAQRMETEEAEETPTPKKRKKASKEDDEASPKKKKSKSKEKSGEEPKKKKKKSTEEGTPKKKEKKTKKKKSEWVSFVRESKIFAFWKWICHFFLQEVWKGQLDERGAHGRENQHISFLRHSQRPTHISPVCGARRIPDICK